MGLSNPKIFQNLFFAIAEMKKTKKNFLENFFIYNHIFFSTSKKKFKMKTKNFLMKKMIRHSSLAPLVQPRWKLGFEGAHLFKNQKNNG